MDSREAQLLARLRSLSDATPDELIRTHQALILPLGHPAAFALDQSGRVVGLKLGGPKNPQAVLDFLPNFRFLKRLVFASHAEKVVLPSELGALPDLEFVWLNGTISKLPPELLLGHEVQLEASRDRGEGNLARHFASLRDLEPIGNLESIDEKDYLFRKSLKLKGVYLASGIEVEDPPLELLAKGPAATRAYLEERTQGEARLNEAKVLLVGDGGCGKTSLVKSMFGEPFDPHESQTHGISIRAKGFCTATDDVVRLNFWDFGGQEIMHATHQFFLSKRSLYILVLDGRKEEDPEYWLQHIESFGGGSPIIVVLNKVDEHPAFEVNRRFLQEKHPGIVSFVRVSCQTGEGIDRLLDALTRQLEQVPILQTRWPAPWFRIRTRLDSLDSPHISLSEYEEICSAEGLTEDEGRQTLVDFLHDLGVVVHFKDIHLLDTHVLDPRWVTGGVYRVLNSDILAAQEGVLRLDQVRKILSGVEGGFSSWPPETHSYIVELMMKFELCYRLDGTRILVPDLLSVQEPEFKFDSDNAIRFVFQYEYLPRSVMPRFIVRMHEDIVGGCRWRSGVLLRDPSLGTEALVRADDNRKIVSIAVSGKQKRDHFAAIRKAIDEINSSFEKLRVTELVPMPGAPEIQVEYSELIGHELASRTEIFIGRIGRSYDVNELLSGIESPKETKRRAANLAAVSHGDYEREPETGMGGLVTEPSESERSHGREPYHPRTWEKVVASVAALLVVCLMAYLLIRNEKVADPNLVVVLRAFVSLALACLGATVPGMLNVGIGGPGLAIRASGALALFVVTFLVTPQVL